MNKSLISSDTLVPPLDPDHVPVADLLVAGRHDAARLVLHPLAGAVRLLASLGLVIAPVMVWLSTEMVTSLATLPACQ